MNSALSRVIVIVLLAATCSGWISCASKPLTPKEESRQASADITVLSLPAPEIPFQEMPGPRLKLSEVVNSEKNGRELDSDALRARYEIQARHFIRFRSGQMKAEERRAVIRACNTTGTQAELVEGRSGLDPHGAFCSYIDTFAFGANKARSRRQAHRARQDAEIRAALFKGNLKALLVRGEGEINRAMKKVTDFARIRPTVDAALASEECPTSALLTALGSQFEDQFPNEESIAKSVALYQRSLECGNGNDISAMKAGYRLALIHLWKNRYAEAEDALKRIVDQPAAADYRTRALYWSAHCAKARDDQAAAKESRAALVKESPLSLHAMLSDPTARGVSLDPDRGIDPEVTYRSLLKPELNDAVRAAEAVQALGKPELSDKILGTLAVDRLGEAEPSFQLYYAVLYKRSGEVIRKFQLLAGLMKANPEVISRSALELFYPLRSFDIIKAHEEVADPYLVVALIRQESAFNERAKSTAGAMGLMQLMPGTARRVGRVSKRLLFDPVTNVKVGVRYFTQLIDRFDGDAELALAAYNAGPGRVDEWVRRYPVSNRLLFLDMIPFRETRDYVASIARNYYWYSRLYDGESRSIAGSSSSPGTPGATPSPAFRPKAVMRVLSLLEL